MFAWYFSISTLYCIRSINSNLMCVNLKRESERKEGKSRSGSTKLHDIYFSGHILQWPVTTTRWENKQIGQIIFIDWPPQPLSSTSSSPAPASYHHCCHPHCCYCHCQWHANIFLSIRFDSMGIVRTRFHGRRPYINRLNRNGNNVSLEFMRNDLLLSYIHTVFRFTTSLWGAHRVIPRFMYAAFVTMYLLHCECVCVSILHFICAQNANSNMNLMWSMRYFSIENCTMHTSHERTQISFVLCKILATRHSFTMESS